MTDPATKEDLEKVEKKVLERLDRMDDSVENMRGQNSAEHGSLFTKLTYITEMMVWIKQKWTNFMRHEPHDKPPKP